MRASPEDWEVEILKLLNPRLSSLGLALTFLRASFSASDILLPHIPILLAGVLSPPEDATETNSSGSSPVIQGRGRAERRPQGRLSLKLEEYPSSGAVARKSGVPIDTAGVLARFPLHGLLLFHLGSPPSAVSPSAGKDHCVKRSTFSAGLVCTHSAKLSGGTKAPAPIKLQMRRDIQKDINLRVRCRLDCFRVTLKEGERG